MVMRRYSLLLGLLNQRTKIPFSRRAWNSSFALVPSRFAKMKFVTESPKVKPRAESSFLTRSRVAATLRQQSSK